MGPASNLRQEIKVKRRHALGPKLQIWEQLKKCKEKETSFLVFNQFTNQFTKQFTNLKQGHAFMILLEAKR
jgi:hypothetical protein